MYIQKIKYTSFDDEDVTEEAMFSMTEAEFAEYNYTKEGGLDNYIKEMQKNKSGKEYVQLIKDLILLSYGQKSADGRRFIKVTPDGRRLADDFYQSQAYSEMFMMIAQDEKKFEAFFKGILPKKVQEKMANADKANVGSIPAPNN